MAITITTLQRVETSKQDIRRIGMRRILRDAVHRTDLHALRRIEVPHTFGATCRIDEVVLRTLVDGLIGTLGLTHITVDALLRDTKRHRLPALTTRRLAQPLVQCGAHHRMYKFTHVAAEGGYLADER